MTATMQGALCVNSSEAVAKRDFPFSREENPLASQLIFLAEVVGAKIAAAAASAAMQELFEKGIILHQELLYSAAKSAGMSVPAPQPASPSSAAAGAVSGTQPAADQNAAAPMDVDSPAAPAASGSANGQVNGHMNGQNVNDNVVQDISAAIPPERLHAASAAAFMGAATKAKMLAEAEGILLSGHAMTVLECMTQKMVIKNKYLNDIENEIVSVHSKLVETRANAVQSRDSIAVKKELLKKEKQLLAAAEKRQREQLAAHGIPPKGSGSQAPKKPADGELPGGAARKEPKLDTGSQKIPGSKTDTPVATAAATVAPDFSSAAQQHAAAAPIATAVAPGYQTDAVPSEVQQLLFLVSERV
jgi:hypothetical protein